MTAAVLLQQPDLRFGNMRVRAVLPPGWRVVNYVPNHHYIELEDDAGNTYRVLATDLIKGVCRSCNLSVFVESRIGTMACPHCVTSTIEWIWGEAKIAFVPELTSKFVTSSPPPPVSTIGEDEDTVP